MNLLGSWFDRDRCRAVNAELDHVHKLMQAFPRLSADLMEVVMRHAQLLLALAKPIPPEPKTRWPPCGKNTGRRSQSARGKMPGPALLMQNDHPKR
jgi:hypothetical protein